MATGNGAFIRVVQFLRVGVVVCLEFHVVLLCVVLSLPMPFVIANRALLLPRPVLFGLGPYTWNRKKTWGKSEIKSHNVGIEATSPARATRRSSMSSSDSVLIFCMCAWPDE